MNISANSPARTEALLLIVFCGFLFFYGLGSFGLIGADEPRYAQVAREMLNRGDWITPTLNGQPWLEKPVLYYWQAMLTYRIARAISPGTSEGANRRSLASADSLADSTVNERTARVPAAIDATLLIAAIVYFLRRWRPGSEFDAAFITASCAGTIGFARAAATDMPLAACLSIALLGWFDWRKTHERRGLGAFYIFLALGMLAKGPVAPVLAAVIVALFIAAKREWGLILSTLWIPGISLFLVAGLPWYVAVQMRNPEFFRTFVLEHNLARFSSNIYHHPQPFWFYVPVFLLALAPWTIWLLAAGADHVRDLLDLGREWLDESESSWPLFLLIWMLVPIVFFSASQSKLPGYILPSVPAGALLAADYLAERREQGTEVPRFLASMHAILCGALVFGAIMAATIAAHHRLVWGMATYIALGVGVIFAGGILLALSSKNGRRLVREATMVAVVVSVGAIIRLAAPVIDATQSAKPIAESIRSFSHEPAPIALFQVNRTTEYGLEFYLDRPTLKYEGGVPAEAHVLVAASGADSAFRPLLGSRKVSYLTSVPQQKLSVYWIGK